MMLREKDKKQLTEIFRKYLHKEGEVLAFGSRVNGSAHDTSDLDLVIKSHNSEKVDISILLQLKEELRNSNIPIIVQLLDWYRIPESFHKNILNDFEVLF